MNDAPLDLSVLKATQQAAWASGDYAVVGATIQIVGEMLCEALDVRSGWQVLDVAAGNGNVSLAAARRGCRVTSTDYVPALLERGRLRAEAEGWRIDFEVADAEALPFPDARFDAVVSTFGVMFAPNQKQAAAEMMRVCKPGGKLGLACWTPESFVGRQFQLMSRYVPPPAGLTPAVAWGTEERLHELFSSAAEIAVQRRSYQFRSLSPEHWLTMSRRFYGPTHTNFAALDESRQDELARELLALVHKLNRAGDGTMVVPGEYLEIVIRR